MIEPTTLLLSCKENDIPYPPPEILPPSTRDIDMSPPMEMDQPCQDPCPKCGGWCMKVGDYVCWGMCHYCFADALVETPNL